MRRRRELSDLNKRFTTTQIQWATGVLEATQLLDEMYSRCSAHKYLLGDCILAKLNLITKRQVRVNQKRLSMTDAALEREERDG